jgi:hypothetical protein
MAPSLLSTNQSLTMPCACMGLLHREMGSRKWYRCSLVRGVAANWFGALCFRVCTWRSPYRSCWRHEGTAARCFSQWQLKGWCERPSSGWRLHANFTFTKNLVHPNFILAKAFRHSARFRYTDKSSRGYEELKECTTLSRDSGHVVQEDSKGKL